MKDFIQLISDILNDFNDVIKDIIKPRTFFAFLFYATFCYLVIQGRPVPESLNNIVFSLISFWFGMRVGENIKTVNGNGGGQPAEKK